MEVILLLVGFVVVVGAFVIEVVICTMCIVGAIILWWIGMIVAMADGAVETYSWARKKIFS